MGISGCILYFIAIGISTKLDRTKNYEIYAKIDDRIKNYNELLYEGTIEHNIAPNSIDLNSKFLFIRFDDSEIILFDEMNDLIGAKYSDNFDSLSYIVAYSNWYELTGEYSNSVEYYTEKAFIEIHDIRQNQIVSFFY